MARPLLAIPWIIVPVLLISALIAIRLYQKRSGQDVEDHHTPSNPDNSQLEMGTSPRQDTRVFNHNQIHSDTTVVPPRPNLTISTTISTLDSRQELLTPVSNPKPSASPVSLLHSPRSAPNTPVPNTPTNTHLSVPVSNPQPVPPQEHREIDLDDIPPPPAYTPSET